MTIEEFLGKMLRGSEYTAAVCSVGTRAGDTRVQKLGKASGPVTATANILTNWDPPESPHHDLYVNYAASSWCYGLAWRAGIRRLLNVQKMTPYIVKTGVKGEEVGPTGFPEWAADTRKPYTFDLTTDRTYGRRLNEAAKSAKDWLAVIRECSIAKKLNSELDNVYRSFNEAEKFTKLVTLPVLPVIPPPVSPITPRPGSQLRQDLFMRFAYSLVWKTWQKNHRLGAKKGHNIGAVLVSPADRIVACSVNLGTENPIFHAESLLMLKWLGSGGDRGGGYRLYTTLEPCHMCAGLIAYAWPALKVIYGQDDQGIANNALTRFEGCSQTKSNVMYDALNTGPNMLVTLKAAFDSKFSDKRGPVTGFLDHGGAAKPVFRKSHEQLNNFKGNLETGKLTHARTARKLTDLSPTVDAVLDVGHRGSKTSFQSDGRSLDPGSMRRLNALNVDTSSVLHTNIQSVQMFGEDPADHLPVLEHAFEILRAYSVWVR